jgi:hypothetical protein
MADQKLIQIVIASTKFLIELFFSFSFSSFFLGSQILSPIQRTPADFWRSVVLIMGGAMIHNRLPDVSVEIAKSLYQNR